MEGTIWALVPPLLAIIISLITKEVNISLIAGIVLGALIYCEFNVLTATTTVFDIMSEKVYSNMGVLIFLILLGMVVHLMNLSGATYEYARWASEKLKTKRQSLLATFFLGAIIFIDDYFNCLTVGTVMRPITDKNKVSREKLAYIIDSTAAPICIIAPISSWAAAISSTLPESSGIDGFQLFMKTIPYNFYALFSLLLVFMSILFSVDFGKMRDYEQNMHLQNEIVDELKIEGKKGKVFDLILPVMFLIITAVLSMLYTGGYFWGQVSIADAFANCDAITGLCMSATYTIIFIALLYIPRRIVSPKQFMNGLVEGFKIMVPTVLILTFAWTLSGICGSEYLNAGGFITEIIQQYHIKLELIPVIFFVIALLLALSTGTSWGTFAILVPITVAIFGEQLIPLTVISTAAVLGGSVCGDHLSPISDTTILSSTGAGCDHINHVESQMQYGLLVAVISVICYLVAGFTESLIISLLIGIVILLLILSVIKLRYKNS